MSPVNAGLCNALYHVSGVSVNGDHVHDLLAILLLQVSPGDLNQLGQLLHLKLVVLLQQHSQLDNKISSSSVLGVSNASPSISSKQMLLCT